MYMANTVLTDKQRVVFDLIVDRITRNHRPPTYRELASALGMSVKSAFDHVELIEKKGYLIIDRKITRGISISEKEVS